jgi:hypothetical protein
VVPVQAALVEAGAVQLYPSFAEMILLVVVVAANAKSSNCCLFLDE